METKKRKPRTVHIKKVDLLKPLELIGTEDDPCFGKLYDPQEKACQRCGDCELCAIMLGQNNHIARAKEESKGKFKDLENHAAINLVEVKKLAKSRLIELIKTSPKKDQNFIINEVYTIYFIQGLKKATIKKMIDRLISKNLITTTNNELRWKSSKK